MKKNTDRLLGAVDALLTRYLLAGADGQPRPMRYNPLDYQSLKFIENHPDCRPTDICHALFLPPTTVQSVLDRLCKLGLISKHGHPKDKRARIYRLTEEGTRMRSRILAQDRANMQEMLNSLTELEQDQILGLMEKVEKHLRSAM